MSVQTAVPFIATVAPPRRSTAPPAIVRAGRSRRLQTIALVILALTSGALVLWQLGSVNLLGALAGARPGWLAVTVAASLLPFFGAALSLAAFTPGRLPPRRGPAVQVASSYASVVLASMVSQLAVNADFCAA